MCFFESVLNFMFLFLPIIASNCYRPWQSQVTALVPDNQKSLLSSLTITSYCSRPWESQVTALVPDNHKSLISSLTIASHYARPWQSQVTALVPAIPVTSLDISPVSVPWHVGVGVRWCRGSWRPTAVVPPAEVYRPTGADHGSGVVSRKWWETVAVAPTLRPQ